MNRADTTTLPLRVKLAWVTGELAVAAYIGLSQSFMLFYCTTVLLIPPAVAGVALLVPRLVDAFLDPVLGAVSGRARSPLGRRRVYLLIGAPLLGLTFGAVFFVDPSLPLATRVALLMVLFLLSNLAVSLYEVPYSAMVAEMTSDYRERIGLTGLKMMAARIGIICALFLGPIIFRSTEQMADGFRLLGLAAGTFMIVTGLIGFFTTADAPRIDSLRHRFSLRAEYEAVLGNRPVRILWLVFLLQNVAIGATSATTIFFVVYIMGLDAVVTGPLLAAVGITSVVTLAVWVYVARAVGKRTQYMLALAAMAASALPLGFIGPGMVVAFVALMIMHGLADSGTQLGPNSMVPDTVEVDQARSGERREGALFGAWASAGSLA